MSTLRRFFQRMRTIADATDRWFVSLSRGFSSLGSEPRPALGPLAPARDPGPVAAGEVAVEPRPSISLLRATPATDPVTEPAPVPGGTPAGILPLLRALARVMDRHQSTDYRTLPSDEHFWGLLHLVHDLGRPTTDPRAHDLCSPPSPNPTHRNPPRPCTRFG